MHIFFCSNRKITLAVEDWWCFFHSVYFMFFSSTMHCVSSRQLKLLATDWVIDLHMEGDYSEMVYFWFFYVHDLESLWAIHNEGTDLSPRSFVLSRNTKQQTSPHSTHTIEMDSTILILHYRVAPCTHFNKKLNAIWFPLRTAGCELDSWGVYTWRSHLGGESWKIIKFCEWTVLIG